MDLGRHSHTLALFCLVKDAVNFLHMNCSYYSVNPSVQGRRLKCKVAPVCVMGEG